MFNPISIFLFISPRTQKCIEHLSYLFFFGGVFDLDLKAKNYCMKYKKTNRLGFNLQVLSELEQDKEKISSTG